jgi:hypothetical protein
MVYLVQRLEVLDLVMASSLGDRELRLPFGGRDREAQSDSKGQPVCSTGSVAS